MSGKTCSVCDEPDAPTCIYGHPHKPGRASLQCPMAIAHTRCILDDDHTGYCHTEGGYHLTPRELDPAERYGLMRLPVPRKAREVMRLTDEKLRADLATLQGKSKYGLDDYIQALLEEVLVLRALACKSVYEEDNIGQYWCTVCHRTVVDCDAEPNGHKYGPKGPCLGFQLREVGR